MGIHAMKVHHLPRGLIWDHDPPSLTLGCKRFRPLAPKLSAAAADTLSTTTSATFDLKSFIKPESSPRKTGSSDVQKKESPPQATEAAQPGGTRWNPTQEQIGILEMLYRSGMRTPNAQQIEQITAQLSKYGKIEGKNVFYWFQNHKARERQKQKRNSLGIHSHSPRTPPPPFATPTSSSLFLSSPNKEEEVVEKNRYKRKCMGWAFDELEEVNKYCTEEEEEEEEEEKEEEEEEKGEDRTLKLFPLHPEGRSSLRDCWN